MKSAIYILLLFSFSVIGQNSKTDSSEYGYDLLGKKVKNTPMSKVAIEMSSTYHNTSNSDFGSSKYDKDINWAADVDENNVQASLDKFRNEQRKNEAVEYGQIFLKIILVIVIALATFFTLFRKRRRY